MNTIGESVLSKTFITFTTNVSHPIVSCVLAPSLVTVSFVFNNKTPCFAHEGMLQKRAEKQQAMLANYKEINDTIGKVLKDGRELLEEKD